jgi:GT2 family glycosyltransferase
MEPKVFIVILNWNGEKDTKECLESLKYLAYENYKIIVVDNNSSEKSIKDLKNKYPEILYIENNKNLGYSGGNNLGMAYALQKGAEYVWLLNNDTTVEENTLEKLVETGEKDDNIGLISPIVKFYHDRKNCQFAGSYVDWNEKSIVYPHAGQAPIETKFIKGRNVCLWGTALLVKAKIINKIGYLDERYFAYFEDTDYSLRSIKGGYLNVVQTEANIYHKDASQKKAHFYFYMARNEWALWRKYTNWVQKIFYFRRYLLKRIAIFIKLKEEGLTDCADSCLDGIWAGIRGYMGNQYGKIKMPNRLKIIIASHPEMWEWIIEGKIIKKYLK